MVQDQSFVLSIAYLSSFTALFVLPDCLYLEPIDFWNLRNFIELLTWTWWILEVSLTKFLVSLEDKQQGGKFKLYNSMNLIYLDFIL